MRDQPGLGMRAASLRVRLARDAAVFRVLAVPVRSGTARPSLPACRRPHRFLTSPRPQRGSPQNLRVGVLNRAGDVAQPSSTPPVQRGGGGGIVQPARYASAGQPAGPSAAGRQG